MNGFALYRKRAGLTTQAVGAALGINPSTVTKWETDGTLPRQRTLLRVSKLYGCTIDELLAGDLRLEVTNAQAR